ncbi:hypothetical protein [Sphingobacterium hungaricum]|uniref:Uncharacterized protein n=1 Tax=Sphingobacterium hungaricum TaxID=2082723 RepID=A0A928YQP3_9SPHI|nr:hypothetical protein [Sphingobacterium hungaricum]MBE8712558.1 hypothetical protein [Sphingobacterium hungaricum]
MVVELKKVKITKSIFNQLLSPGLSTDTLRKHQVLGWVFDKSRYILLYHPDTNSLSKFPLISNMKIDERKPNQVSFMIKGMASSVQLSGYSDSINWIVLINEIQTKAKIEGQLYI